VRVIREMPGNGQRRHFSENEFCGEKHSKKNENKIILKLYLCVAFLPVDLSYVEKVVERNFTKTCTTLLLSIKQSFFPRPLFVEKFPAV
jgi:hypothetical protein